MATVIIFLAMTMIGGVGQPDREGREDVLLTDREGREDFVLAEIRGASRVKRPNSRYDPATYLIQ